MCCVYQFVARAGGKDLLLIWSWQPSETSSVRASSSEFVKCWNSSTFSELEPPGIPLPSCWQLERLQLHTRPFPLGELLVLLTATPGERQRTQHVLGFRLEGVNSSLGEDSVLFPCLSFRFIFQSVCLFLSKVINWVWVLPNYVMIELLLFLTITWIG